MYSTRFHFAEHFFSSIRTAEQVLYQSPSWTIHVYPKTLHEVIVLTKLTFQTPSNSNIPQEGYLLSKGKRFKFGRGIYSSPSIEVAAKYAKVFTHEGKKYQLVFQNCVSPEGLVVIDGSDTGVGEYWVQSNEKLMRPYGICMRRI